MNAIFNLLKDYLPLLIWVILFSLGGIWIIQSSFNLRKNEQTIAGVGLGIVLQIWLSNILAQVIPFTTAIMASAALIAITGLAFSIKRISDKPLKLFEIPIQPLQWLALAGLAYLFIRLGRGLAILDDYQNLPITSLLATGDVPPRFALDPNKVFGYHYFSMLFAAELMRFGDMYVWTALDIARGLGFAISLILGALFVQRVTTSKTAGVLSVLNGLFSGGTRWLFLLLPTSILARISQHINLIGTGAQSAADLSTALLSPWAAEGLGMQEIPFAFVNGFNATSALTFQAGAGGVPGIIGGILMLTHNRWLSWKSGAVISVLIGALALGNEVGFVTLLAGFALVAGIYLLIRRHRPPQTLLRWFPTLLVGGIIAVLQGGVLTGIAVNIFARFFPSLGSEQAYHTFNFALVWPPTLLSSHLGELNLLNPYQLLAALIEIGPIIVVFPLVVAWSIKAFRYGRWYEAASIFIALASLVFVFVQYSGTAGPTALTRVQNTIVGLCKGFAVPALWLWGRHRSDLIKVGIGVLFLVTFFGGIVLLGLQLVSAPKPVYSNFLNDLDARMTSKYWNQLEPDALVLDPYPYRAPVVFGRPNISSNSWYEQKPEWEALINNPIPSDILASGHRYLYIDEKYWESLSDQGREYLSDACLVVVEKYEQEFPRDFRILYDLQGCK